MPFDRTPVQTAEIIEKNGLSFQDFWRYTLKTLEQCTTLVEYI